MHELNRANRSARSAKPSDCANCLGAIGIKCPLKYGDDGVDTEALKDLRGMELLATKRLSKSLGATPTINPPRDRILALGLTSIGFTQTIENFPEPIAGEPEELPITPRLSPVAKTPKETTEERPPCAGTLNRFIHQSRTTIESFRPDRDAPRPIDHSTDEATWKEAVDQSRSAQAPDCKSCLGENCPLLHGVEPRKFYNSINKSRTLPSGRVIRASEVVVRITSGKMRGAETVEAIDDLETNLKRKVTEAKG